MEWQTNGERKKKKETKGEIMEWLKWLVILVVVGVVGVLFYTVGRFLLLISSKGNIFPGG